VYAPPREIALVYLRYMLMYPRVWAANIPHNPIRFSNTVGLVIEQDRPEGMNDKLRWYCPNESCRKLIHEASFYCTDLGNQVKEAVVEFTSRPKDERVCQSCGVGVAGERPVVRGVGVGVEEKGSKEGVVNDRRCSLM